MVVDIADLAALAADKEVSDLAEVAFSEPVISDPRLAGDFLALHTAPETPTTRLERDERLTGWLRADRPLPGRPPAAIAARPPRRQGAALGAGLPRPVAAWPVITEHSNQQEADPRTGPG